LVAFQVSVVCSPLAIVVDPATKLIVGASSATITSVCAVLVPVGPAHVTAKFVVSMMLETVMVPLTGCGPLIPLVPTHDVAEVVCSVRFMLPPDLTVVAAGVREICGPAVVAATGPQATSIAAVDSMNNTRSSCAVRDTLGRVMSYAEFFFWIRRLQAGNKLTFRRKLKDNI
jgi:hypothetical protein